MAPRVKKALSIVGSFLLAGVLLYVALRQVEFAAVGEALRTADYRWLIPLALVTLLSHALRAWRWTLLLDVLPGHELRTHPVSKRTAFYAVLIGYMANYAAPRLGEVLRSANVASKEDLSFAQVFGTVVVERILDVIVLAFALLSVLVLLFDQFTTVSRVFFEPIMERLDGMAISLLVIAAVVVLAVGIIAARLLLRRAGDGGLIGRIASTLDAFRAGLVSLLAVKARGALVFSTLAMWFCYLLMAHLPFMILGMDVGYGLGLLDSWSIMNLGAIGVALPSPGGIGTYHYITMLTLNELFAVDNDAAASYALLTHAGQMVLYTVFGAIALVVQGTSWHRLKKEADAVKSSSH